MANTALVQIRTAEEDKQRASEILESLGTNLSAVFNMMLKQIILTEGIPFDITLHPTKQKAIDAVSATMRLEDMDLEEEDLELLKAYQNDPEAGDRLRAKILADLGVKNE